LKCRGDAAKGKRLKAPQVKSQEQNLYTALVVEIQHTLTCRVDDLKNNPYGKAKYLMLVKIVLTLPEVAYYCV
jgi:hypothetical protein